MKTIAALIIIVLLGIGGYCVYLGLTESGKNNSGLIATDVTNLTQSVTDTFKDGVSVLATKASVAKDSALSAGSRALDSAKDKASEVATDAKTAVVSAASSAKEGVADAVTGVAK